MAKSENIDNFYKIQKDKEKQVTVKRIKVLENKMNVLLVKYNETVAHNKKMRDEVD